jgi:hypothetical protein
VTFLARSSWFDGLGGYATSKLGRAARLELSRSNLGNPPSTVGFSAPHRLIPSAHRHDCAAIYLSNSTNSRTSSIMAESELSPKFAPFIGMVSGWLVGAGCERTPSTLVAAGRGGITGIILANSSSHAGRYCRGHDLWLYERPLRSEPQHNPSDSTNR